MPILLNYDCLIEICKNINNTETLQYYMKTFEIKNHSIYKHLYELRYSAVLREFQSKEVLINYYGNGKIRLISKPLNVKKILDSNYCHLC